MKETFWTYILMIIGLFVLVVLFIIQDLTSTSEADYYMTKEVMQAAMIDSIDYGVYRKYGDIRIIEEKFVENFIRRFSESTRGSKTYKIEFYEIYEEPPKATVRVKTATSEYQVEADEVSQFGIVTLLSGIIETKYEQDCVQKGTCTP